MSAPKTKSKECCIRPRLPLQHSQCSLLNERKGPVETITESVFAAATYRANDVWCRVAVGPESRIRICSFGAMSVTAGETT